MKDQIVSLETAKLAKEKEFNEICLNMYKFPGGIPTLCEGVMYYNNRAALGGEDLPACTAPSQGLLQRWLREKHSIIVTIRSHFYGMKTPHTVKYQYVIFVHGDEREFDVYEECLEEGLKEALNLINLKK